MKKEWKCFAHGFFEAEGPTCPWGCDTAVERAFLTAPGIASTRTRNIDRTLEALAKDYGMTDMTNRRGNGSVGEGMPTEGPQGEWVNVPQGPSGLSQALAARVNPQRAQAVDRFIAERNLTPPPNFSGVKQDLPTPRPLIADPRLRWGKPSDIAEAAKRMP